MSLDFDKYSPDVEGTGKDFGDDTLATMFFEYAPLNYKLTAKHQQFLRDLVDTHRIRQHRFTAVIVEGRASKYGTATQNRIIAGLRLDEVMKYLRGQGTDMSLVLPVNSGEDHAGTIGKSEYDDSAEDKVVKITVTNPNKLPNQTAGVRRLERQRLGLWR